MTPGEMARTRAQIEMRRAQGAFEPQKPRKQHPEDVRAEPATMGAAIARAAAKTRRVKRGR